MRGIFLDCATINPHDLSLDGLKASLPDWSLRTATAADEVGQVIRDADVVVSNKVMLDQAAIQAARSLKLVCVAATGTNNVDLVAAAESNVTVCNVRGYATGSVVEHVFSLILALNRHLCDYSRAVNAGRWQDADSFCLFDYPVRELAGQTLGIIGYGELGRAVAATGKAFGMKILVAQRPGSTAQPDRTPLDELLASADIISLHCPLTDTTRNLIDRDALGLMKKDALLVNTARGGIVNESALRQALLHGEIAGAAVDVLTEEPPRHGNPLLDSKLANLIVTPHIAWASRHARQSLLDGVTDNIHAFLDGRPRNVVTAG